MAADHLVFDGHNGPGKGKHLVFLAGDEEYRSEEAMPLMAEIMSKHGFKCTVLFSMDKNNKFVDPNNQKSLSFPEALDSADGLIMSLRFRNWNDHAMQKFDEALLRGVPVVALRTSTHAFKFPADSKWAKYSFNSKADTGWTKGFGREVLGETWVSHHGKHKKEGCRAVIEPSNYNHSILNNVGPIFVTTDVYGTNPPADATILLRGEVTATLEPDSTSVVTKNNPMQALAWTREYKNSKGNTNRIFTTTMGAASDLTEINLRRLIANAIYWSLDLPVPKKAKVFLPGIFKPSFYSFNAFQKNKKPEDFIVSKTKISENSKKIKLQKGSRIVLFGNGLASRMVHYGEFETELHLRNPDKNLVIRNLADEGNTPSFRPHSGRSNQMGFPGAQEFFGPYADGNATDAQGHFETDEEWITKLKPDTLIAFFGFNESFLGPKGIDHVRAELDAFLKHTLQQTYGASQKPSFVLVSPTAYEDRSSEIDVPKGVDENKNLALVTKVMREIAAKHKILFIDAFTASKTWYQKSKQPLTTDGALLNAAGYQKLATFLSDEIFGKTEQKAENIRKKVQTAVMDKNWFWVNYFKIPNGVHVFGRRYNPFGPANYPDELKKLSQMTDNRDTAIWNTLQGQDTNLEKLDATTHTLSKVETNYNPSNKKNGALSYLKGKEALNQLTVPEGYKVEQWATETDFPDLANPVQMAFDNKGRLWVATMPSYPHYRPGDALPDDKLIILEDTDGDGKADKQTTWADHLHLPMGFEITEFGVLVSQGINLVLLKDTDGDDKADSKEVLYSGFDDHDTHHAIGAYTADPSGAIFMCEGVFLRSNIETPYGPVRGTNGGFFRYNHQRRNLERHAQLNIPNPWGVAFDDWGQHFFLYTSGTKVEWMLPGSVKSRYGVANPASKDLIEAAHKVRPTSGIEFLISSHFPDEVQGDLLLNNNIGYLGTKQHQIVDDGTGYSTKHRQDLITSKDGNFRPVDLEVAPDGSLYIVDWHNPLIGHMQHNARDPNRDHSHGRVYRITYPSRPLVKPAKIDGAPVSTLLENLKLHEYRSRYRTRRELRSRDSEKVLPALKKWVAQLNKSDEKYEHHLLEALYVTWGYNQVDQDYLNQLLSSKNHKARAAATRVVRYNGHQLKNQTELLKKSAQDDHGRVVLEAITAASWLKPELGLEILKAAENKSIVTEDDWVVNSYKNALAHLNNQNYQAPRKWKVRTHLKGEDKKLFTKGYEIYHREGYCGTCHQDDGKGLPSAGFPPLADTKWVLESPERLIKITLNGLHGPIEVKGKMYPGQVPMTPFAGMLKDEEVASVLTYVRNSFGNKASAIKPEQVKKVRAETKDKAGFYSPEELLKAHPHK
jgi:mono/diheme cytochrome c family protein/glucose/arabinose dehydrogenase